ncbi:MAG: hypothetical protein JWQ27_3164 [Ferruginibacter sp.]|nr:hypothetical protein [Ferruginibacter sp.]
MYLPKRHFAFLLLLISFISGTAYAQPTWTLDPFGKEKKPEQYEEKKLGSEKTAEKKFTTFRRIIQNNVSHYNFYFNANNKLNAVIERAKLSQKDDYSKLLSFYPYSLESTAAQQTELDSVIYKATAGILLHDLRTDWVDNLYLLIGKSYLLRREFDSAAITFQFINYNLFPRKKKEDDSRIVGTNDVPATGAITIANKENRNIIQKALTQPPSRNDALIWLVRTFIEQEEYGDAAGLLNILQNDRNLPQRLRNDLEEVNAYWFFNQGNYDSASTHLEKALSNADTKQDKSRWEFLLAQLFEMKGDFKKASDYYAKASKHTVDPIMDIYAQLNDAKMMRNSGNFKELQGSIDKLLKMAKRDKYEEYRDIIYYSTAQLSMQKPDTTNSIAFYKKSVLYNTNNALYKNKSYLQLADLAYTQRQYQDAYSFYDSLDLAEPSLASVSADLGERKETLGRLVQKVITIQTEDSLQRIAGMAPADRDGFLKKMLKKYRKENGLKEDDNFAGNTLITFNNQKNEPVDLFASPAKGEWYFYNNNLRSRGFSDFKAKWGKRTNVDNWRRKNAVEAKVQSNGNALDINPDSKSPDMNAPSKSISPDYSYDGLMGGLPLTPEKIDSSNARISDNLLALAKIFQNELLDYEEAINTYNEYLRRFPSTKQEAEVYLGLYYCYTKLGETAKAATYKNIVTTKYAGTSFSNMIVNPAALEPNKKNPEVSARYERIYDMFIEGKFAEAIDAKKKADSIYGNNYWTPQLLYIEAVNDIKEKNDSAAIVVLNNLQTLYPTSPLKEKAATLVEVLGRRAAIEQYLTNLQVTRQEEDQVIVADDKPVVVQKPVVQAPVVVAPAAPVVRPVTTRDSSLKVPPVFINGGFTLDPNKPHYVVMLLDKVDGVYINEAKNAFSRFNRSSMATQGVVITRDALDAERALLLFATFPDADAAMKYYDKIKRAAPSEVSWLQPNKYSFLIISEANLQVLKTNKDLAAYKQLLNTNFGNKF